MCKCIFRSIIVLNGIERIKREREREREREEGGGERELEREREREYMCPSTFSGVAWMKYV